MRTFFAATVVSLLGIAVASVELADGARWAAPTFLFWLVVIAASLCVVAAVYVARLAHRLDQLELAVVAAFFFAASVLPLVHGLTVPGVWYGDNMATMTSVFLAIPAGAICAGFVGFGPGSWRVRLLGGMGLTLVLGAVLLLQPELRVFPDPGSAWGVVAALTTFALTVGFAKRDVAHGELIRSLRRRFDRREVDIGFAGMKDKTAVTRQMVSVRCADDPATVDIPHDRITVLWAARHDRKIRRGHLAGNRFSIRIRDVDPLKVPVVRRQLERLAATGAPAYFDAQRFGVRGNNQVLGAHLLRRDWDAVLRELVGTAGAVPAAEQARREAFERGDYEAARDQWSPAARAERAALTALCRGRTPEQACRSVGRSLSSLWVSALQSAVFNRVLDWRLEQGRLGRLEEGDLAWVHDKGAVFAVTAGELAEPALETRLAALEVSPSGPLWGPGMTEAGGRIAEIERAALDASGAGDALASGRRREATGARRPLRAPLSNIEVESGVDEHGAFIRVAFDLPRGLYATIVLREIMKTESDVP